MDNLFDSGCSTALARKNDPQTSKDAAKMMVDSGKLSRQEIEVLSVIKFWHSGKDFTTKDIAARMQVTYPFHKAYDICRKRFSGLANKGKIKLIQTGVKVINPEQVPSLRIVKPVYKKRDGCRIYKLL